VVNADGEVRPFVLRRRVPRIGRSVQSVADSVIIRRGVRVEQLGNRRINPDVARIIGEEVICGYAISVAVVRAWAHAWGQGAGLRVNERWDVLAAFEVTVLAGEQARRVDNGEAECLINGLSTVTGVLT
jgi:hypothetical protein